MKVNREFPPKVRLEVAERANGICEVCRLNRMVHVHHKRMRSQGGTGELSNALGVCTPCHNHIHHFPAESYELGYLLHAGIDA